MTVEPVASSTDYNFQLDLYCKTGLSVDDVLHNVGLNLDTDLKSSFPPLESLIKKVKMRRFFIGMELTYGTISFSDGSIEHLVEEMTNLPKFVLSGVQLTISKTASGNFSCERQAGLSLEAKDKYLTVGCTVPQVSLPGFIEVDAPLSLTLGELVKYFSDLDISAILIRKDLFNIHLNRFHIELRYKKTKASGNRMTNNTKLSVFGVSASLSKDELVIPIGDA